MKANFYYILKLLIGVVAAIGAVFMIFGMLGYVADLPNYRFLVFSGIVILGCIAFPMIMFFRYQDNKDQQTFKKSKPEIKRPSNFTPLRNGA